jgi:rhodanese-related sulfurtransferase
MTLNKKYLIFLLLIPFFGCAQDFDPNSEITTEQLKKNLETDSTLVILDVRTKPELTGPLGSISGIIHIPLQELNQRLDELEPYKNENIAIICRSGNRSGVATKMLKSQGFKAKNVLGGMIAWNKISN